MIVPAPLDLLIDGDRLPTWGPDGRHFVTARQMGGVYGGMVSFELGDEAAAVRVLEALRLFTLAESLGAVESLAEHPGLMTHVSVPSAERRRTGLGDGLLRLSVGIEDLDDLLADLDDALQRAG